MTKFLSLFPSLSAYQMPAIKKSSKFSLSQLA